MTNKPEKSPSYRNITKNSHRREKIPQYSKDPRQKRMEVQQIKEELKDFAKSRWGKRWVNAILEYGRPYRMQRGIRYAQEDRITHLTVSPGLIFATVQGTAPTPYRVKVLFDTISEKGWDNLLKKIAEKVKYIILLLENKMPEDMEDIFEDAGFPLFPTANRAFRASCSCPDHEKNNSICKHIAATVLYVARVIDFDPFLILKLRGKTKDEILSELQAERSCSKEPIAQSIKKIRKMAYPILGSFDIPSIQVQELVDREFSMNSDPLKIWVEFNKPTAHLETLEMLGAAPHLEDPDSFKLVMRDLYLDITKKVYNTAIRLESDSQKGKKKKIKK
jgi:uncharacterized Zn finger protein